MFCQHSHATGVPPLHYFAEGILKDSGLDFGLKIGLNKIWSEISFGQTEIYIEIFLVPKYNIRPKFRPNLGKLAEI